MSLRGARSAGESDDDDLAVGLEVQRASTAEHWKLVGATRAERGVDRAVVLVALDEGVIAVHFDSLADDHDITVGLDGDDAPLREAGVRDLAAVERWRARWDSTVLSGLEEVQIESDLDVRDGRRCSAPA